MGFFSQNKISTMAVNCPACGLVTKCRTPRMPPTGNGKRKILIIGEAPNETEDKLGLPFAGAGGCRFIELMEEFGIDFHRDCWATNSVCCHVSGHPSKLQIGACRKSVMDFVYEKKPTGIFLLGHAAIESIIGHDRLGESNFHPNKWAGWAIPSREFGATLFPMYCPYTLLGLEEKDAKTPLLALYRQHIKNALDTLKNPPVPIGDFVSSVTIETEKPKAIRLLRRYLRNAKQEGKPLAFDYETTGLKPDSPKQQIISVSVSDGKTALAVPWFDEMKSYFCAWLGNPKAEKIASNLKFEAVWSHAILGVQVKGWLWDTMLGAHFLDNRSDITSIKFQSYVLLGASDYDSEISPFLKSGGSNQLNRIREIPMEKLLLYNALDSLYEFKVAMIQREKAAAAKGEK